MYRLLSILGALFVVVGTPTSGQESQQEFARARNGVRWSVAVDSGGPMSVTDSTFYDRRGRVGRRVIVSPFVCIVYVYDSLGRRVDEAEYGPSLSGSASHRVSIEYGRFTDVTRYYRYDTLTSTITVTESFDSLGNSIEVVEANNGEIVSRRLTGPLDGNVEMQRTIGDGFTWYTTVATDGRGRDICLTQHGTDSTLRTEASYWSWEYGDCDSLTREVLFSARRYNTEMWHRYDSRCNRISTTFLEDGKTERISVVTYDSAGLPRELRGYNVSAEPGSSESESILRMHYIYDYDDAGLLSGVTTRSLTRDHDGKLAETTVRTTIRYGYFE